VSSTTAFSFRVFDNTKDVAVVFFCEGTYGSVWKPTLRARS